MSHGQCEMWTSTVKNDCAERGDAFIYDSYTNISTIRCTRIEILK